MSGSNHNPGPWKAVFNGMYFDIVYNNEKIGDVCASAFLDKGDNQEANARLIAAAPDLYMEAIRYMDILAVLEESGYWDECAKGTGITTANGLRNAIAKAEGKQ